MSENVDDRAPISPGGWQIWRHTYKGEPAKLLQTAMSLDWCRQYLTNWKAHSAGTAELYISPVDGWDSIKADFAGAIAWAIAQNLVSIEHGASLIRAIAEERADSLPAEALMGLAVFYARAALTDMGGDDEIEQVVDKLVENQRRLVVGIDEPAIPF